MKLITKKQQDAIDKSNIQKLQFVAQNAILRAIHYTASKEDLGEMIREERQKAEQVYWADAVIL